MTDEQFNSISDKLDKILEELQSTSSRIQPKTGENTPRSDLKTLTGQSRWVRNKERKVFLSYLSLSAVKTEMSPAIYGT